ncbi:MAG: type II CRISPR RNA-guided endonuclease Cas9 [Rhodospirillales bacterium]|nr:type II CRISPR RNA-guided endonuclease Cas9 [Rhodospirillales bacterium]
MAEQRPYRLGLDLGANSLGWAMIWLDEGPSGLGPAGVRIFPDGRDPQSKSSNAVSRRVARGARRRRDRYLQRRKELMAALIEAGLMPAGEAERKKLQDRDPYEIRARGLDKRLSLHELGRALFHINQRRGFKSNRKTDRQNEEGGVIAKAAGKLEQMMLEEGARTLGELLAGRHSGRLGVRARPEARPSNVSSGAKAAYEFYPTRDMLEQEFVKLWEVQRRQHPELTAELHGKLHHIIFFQRPLVPPQVGKCALDPAKRPDDREGFRCPWAHPLAQRFRILQEVNNLTAGPVGERKRKLTAGERCKALHELLQTGAVTFEDLRTALKLESGWIFNLHSDRRDELKGDETAAALCSSKEALGKFDRKIWHSFPAERQAGIVERLLEEEDEEELIAWLIEETGVSKEQAYAIATVTLPDSHCRLGLRALKAIVPFMEEGQRYHQAAASAGYDHARLPTGEIRENLPYYGEILQDQVLGSGDARDPAEQRWGRLPNPTVHIGLNQLRRVVNALIRRFGPPQEIVVEMARSFKLSPDQLRKLELEQRENQRKNDDRRKELEKLGLPVNYGNLLKLRLWEELNPKDALDRQCPFTGEQIGMRRLLSEEVEIEHLLPFSRSWDDSPANKTVCLRAANRAKGQKAPYEAFGSSPTYSGQYYDWEAIKLRAKALPPNKRWRFDPDAMQRFEAGGGFLARQLNETSWLARLAKQYLGAVTDPRKIWVVPGRLTALLRRKWGLDDLLDSEGGRKNRNDHRHHALDALTAGLTDRGLLQRMAREYDEERERIVVKPPWEGFRQDVARVLEAILVSHKPDHGAQGQLHEDTAYGRIAGAKEGEGNLVYRKPFLALKETEVERIRDARLRDELQAAIGSGKAADKRLPNILAEFAKEWGERHGHGALRHVRLTKTEKPDYLVHIGDGAAPYKAYSAGANLCVELYETPDGKWRGEAVSLYQANQAGHQPRWPAEEPGARLVMRLHKGDCISLEEDGQRRYVLVKQLRARGRSMFLAEHHEAGALQTRHDDKEDPFRWRMYPYDKLRQLKAEPVRIDEIGRPWRLGRALPWQEWIERSRRLTPKPGRR